MDNLFLRFRLIWAMLLFTLVDFVLGNVLDLATNLIVILLGKDLVILGALYLWNESYVKQQVQIISNKIAHAVRPERIDLNISVPTPGMSSLAPFSENFNQFSSNCENAVLGIAQSSSRLSPMSNELAETYNNMAHQATLQSDFGNNVSASVQRMYDASTEVKEHAHSISTCVDQATSVVHECQSAVTKTGNSIRHLSTQMETAAQDLSELQKASDQIGSITDVINGIAEQTNLLALNAAIEAARAGEQGRGFAVVADEVRTLAQRTHVSTTEVKEMIEAIQHSTSQLSHRIQESNATTSQSVEQSDNTQRELDSIHQAVEEVNKAAKLIISSIEEQASAAEDVRVSINGIQELNASTLDEKKTRDVSPEDLQKLGVALKQKIEIFKLSQKGRDESTRPKKDKP